MTLQVDDHRKKGSAHTHLPAVSPLSHFLRLAIVAYSTNATHVYVRTCVVGCNCFHFVYKVGENGAHCVMRAQ